MNIPKTYWFDGALTAYFLINRIPSNVLKGTCPLQVLRPDDLLFPIPPKVFGGLFHSHPKTSKGQVRSKSC